MNRTIVDLHVLQTVPPSNLNRDDTHAPKTGIYGGTLRARVSSQAWKHAVRRSLTEILEPSELGVRTKQAAAILAARIKNLDASLTQAQATAAAAEAIKAATGSRIGPSRRQSSDVTSDDDIRITESAYLLFFSAQQLDGLARLAADSVNSPGGITKFFQDKHNKARARELAHSGVSVDIALFGRMVAETADLNVEAATQVAHAISVHPVEVETDYYTAVDDQATPAEPSAAMIGTVEFDSATFYRYAALDVDQLARNLTSTRTDATATTLLRRAVEAFVHSFITSLPTGKITAFGHSTLPDAVIIKLRTARAVSFAGAFERPVHAAGAGYLKEACQALADYIPALERAYGVEDTLSTWLLRVDHDTEPLVGLGNELPLPQLVREVGAAAVDRLEEQP